MPFLRCLFIGLSLMGYLATFTASAQAPAPNRFTSSFSSRIKVTDVPADKKVNVEIDGKLFTSYCYGLPGLKKPVLFPINSPKGNPITRGWPIAPRAGERIDHAHHVGAWFNYGDVNGVDFWNNSNAITPDHKGPFGQIVHKKINLTSGGKLIGMLETASEWQGPDGKPMLEETTHFDFEGQGLDRIITRTTTLKAVSGDMTFTDNKEGLYGLRLCRQLELASKEPVILTDADGKPGTQVAANQIGVTGEFINSEAQTGDSIWGKRAEFTLIRGMINNESVSVAFVDHPANPGFPTYWHARGYGLFAANPLGQEVFSKGAESLNMKIKKGESVTFKYQIRIQSGRQLQEADIQRIFTQFSAKEEKE